MRLLPRRRAPAALALSPAGPVRPTATVTATLTLGEPLDRVTAARVALGYVNTYRHHWAGRRDAALRHDDGALANLGQVGTAHGSDREASDWVPVLDESLSVAAGTLEAGSHVVALRLPSWSPGSSASAVRWEVRVHVVRDGRDVELAAPLEVLVPAPDPPPAPFPLIQGERILADSLTFGLDLDGVCHRAGAEVRGTVHVTPREPVTRSATVDIRFLRRRLSHPLERTPSAPTDATTRPHVVIASDVRLEQGRTSSFPFAAALPPDADPTTAAVHSSLEWFVVATVTFAGATGAIERARRGIVVHTA